MTNWLKFGSIALLSALVFGSCSNSDRDEDKDVNASVDYTIVSNAYNDLWKEFHKQIATDLRILDSNLTTNPATHIDSITVFPGGFIYPKTIHIYYNGSNLDDFNRRRSGVLKATLSAPYYLPGSSIQFDLSAYSMNGLTYEGDLSLTLDSSNSQFFFYTRTINNGLLTDGVEGFSGTNIRLNATQSAYLDTSIVGIDNDLFSTTEIDCNGMATVGTLFSATNDIAIQFSYDCEFDYGGVTQLDVPNIAPRTVRLPVGSTCLNQVVVEINLSYQEVAYNVGSAELPL